MASDTWRVITHLHSRSSNGLASSSHRLVTEFARREFGATADLVDWAECETSISDLEDILNGRRTRQRVDVICLTDHMSPSRHVIEDDTLDFARRCSRFAIGAEIRT